MWRGAKVDTTVTRPIQNQPAGSKARLTPPVIARTIGEPPAPVITSAARATGRS